MISFPCEEKKSQNYAKAAEEAVHLKKWDLGEGFGIQTNNTHDTISSYVLHSNWERLRLCIFIYCFQLKCQVMGIEEENKKHFPHPTSMKADDSQ